MTIAREARLSALESVFVLVTLAECEQSCEPAARVPRASGRTTENDFPESCWEMFDRVKAVRRAFEASLEAVRSQDVAGDARDEKLFCLLLAWLLTSTDSHRVPKQSCSVVRFVQCWCLERVDARGNVIVELAPSGILQQCGFRSSSAEAACCKVQLGRSVAPASQAPGTDYDIQGNSVETATGESKEDLLRSP